MQVIIFIAILIYGGGIAIILKTGFNQMIKGLASIDERLRRIEEKLDK